VNQLCTEANAFSSITRRCFTHHQELDIDTGIDAEALYERRRSLKRPSVIRCPAGKAAVSRACASHSTMARKVRG
jgi:hypothetical protein